MKKIGLELVSTRSEGIHHPDIIWEGIPNSVVPFAEEQQLK